MTALAKKTIEPDSSGLFYESRVAAALGIDRKVLAKLRKQHLAEGSGFARIANNAVALTAQGLAVIEEVLQASTSDTPAEKSSAKPGFPASKPASDIPAGPPPRARMTVARAPQNSRILLCVGLTPPREVAVRVATNANFIAGMEIETICSGDGVWQFRNRAGSDESTVGRLPRGKGRW